MQKDELRKSLKGIQGAYNTDYKVVEEMTKRGMSSLLSKIKDVEVSTQTESVKEKPEHTPNFQGHELAEKQIDVYKTKIKDVTPKIGPVEDDRPVTYADRERLKAVARSLTGGRNGGNAGKLTQSTPNGNGDLGQYSPPAENGDGNLGTNTAYGQYYALTTSMTLEQYQEYIDKKFMGEGHIACGVCACDPCECDNEIETDEGEDVIEVVKEALLELNDTAWQSIDIVMRAVAETYEVTPKELHKAFKHQEGMIPDQWLEENREKEICGFMPLEEAVLQRVGNVYEVSMMWRGGTKRLKFFWPEVTAPSKLEIQKAAESFYPGCRVLAHYLAPDDRGNYMVVVPPMTENYHFVPEDNWLEMPEELQDSYDFMCEEEGEPLCAPYINEENNVEVIVEDHDTGEEKTIVFENKSGDSSLHDWFSKSKSSDGKPGWVQLGGKYAGKPCARQPGQNTKPKCGSSKMKRNLNKKEEDAAFRRKNRQDGNPDRKGKAINVATEELKCWDGYKRKKGAVPGSKGSCVKEGDEMKGMSQKSGDKRSTESGAGMTAQGVAKYNRRTGGNLKTAVTTPPSKLKPGSKAAGRRKSFCARSRGWTGERGKAARRRWNC